MEVKKIVEQMTLEEKAGLSSGFDAWSTKAVSRLGIPAISFCDGPHGIRKEQVSEDDKNIFHSVPAVCFPAESLVACSFDRQVLKEMGNAIAEECISEGVDVILGPSINIKRSPLCGRNFEYLSEDPLLAGELAAAYIQGVQENGVGTSVKHFCANSQEFRRLTSSSEVDERTLREIYLTNFEIAVKKGKPWSVMAAYNKVNGIFSTEQRAYIEDILYKEWGFDGIVVSDWGAVHNRTAAAKGGTAITMPSDTEHDAELIEAVKSGELEEKTLDRLCERILSVIFKARKERKAVAGDKEKALDIACRLAEESIVLLKNENVLPLKEQGSIAFIGPYAKKPRYEGGGSSHINSYKVLSAWESVKNNAKVVYGEGCRESGELDPDMLQKAVEIAGSVDTAVLFVGLPEGFESEGYDRNNMRMPDCQNELIEAVVSANPNTVVVLHHGAPVEMPWADKVAGILDTYLGGDAVGLAVTNILFGKVNPSGKLAESIPYQVEDNPSWLFYQGEADRVEYREGVFVGYRYYETKRMKVRYPFGYGLSYTDFTYLGMELDKDTINAEADTLSVTVEVKNTGNMKGKEVVQLYVVPGNHSVLRPVKELKGFQKVELEPGEAKKVTFVLEKRAFAYWNMQAHDWNVESGKYQIVIGKDAHQEVLRQEVTVQGKRVQMEGEFTELSTIGDLLRDAKGAAFWDKMQSRFAKAAEDAGFSEHDAVNSAAEDQIRLLYSLPCSMLASLIPDYSNDDLKKDLDEINKKDWRIYD